VARFAPAATEVTRPAELLANKLPPTCADALIPYFPHRIITAW